VVFQLPEVAREVHVFGARDVLVAEEQHAMLHQQLAHLGHQFRRARGDADVEVEQLGADRAGQRLDLDRVRQRAGADHGGRVLKAVVHAVSPAWLGGTMPLPMDRNLGRDGACGPPP
jgi:hypothetical protein